MQAKIHIREIIRKERNVQKHSVNWLTEKEVVKEILKNTCYLFLLLSILLTACAKSFNSPIKHFEGKPLKKLYPSRIVDLEEFGILNPVQLIQIDDSVFVIRDSKNENIVNIINLSSKKVISGVNIGQGPGEVLDASRLQYRNNKILAWDGMPKKMYEVVVLSDVALAIKEFYKVDTDMLISSQLNHLDSTFIAVAWFQDYWLVEMNKDGKILSTIDFPMWEGTKNIPKTALANIYQSLMANSPDNKRIAVAALSQGLISFLNRTDSGIKEYKQLKYHAPIFTVNEGGRAVTSRDNLEGFRAIDCDDTHVYVMYSGKTFNSNPTASQSGLCDHLLVYDWNGNPVKRYILGIPIRSIKYNKETNSIYGLAENPEGVLVEYQL